MSRIHHRNLFLVFSREIRRDDKSNAVFSCPLHEATFSVNVAVAGGRTFRDLAKHMATYAKCCSADWCVGANWVGFGYAPRKLTMPQQNPLLSAFHFDPAGAHRRVFRTSLGACAAV